MNGVIYARYSSHNQREESIEGQIRKCREFAESQNITIIGEYVDRALSGKTDKRDSFQRLIKDSSKGHFQCVIMYTLDRFARNRYDSAHYKSILKKNGVRLFYTEQSITDEPEGIILESVLEGMAEYYSENLARGIRRGMKENAYKCMIHNKKRKDAEHHMFSGLLVCSDCGANLHYHFNQGNHSIQFFSCSNYNSRNKTCPTTHYIRTDFLEEIVLTDINRLIAFTNQYKDEFVRILENNSGLSFENQLKSAQTEMEKLCKRNEEIDRLFEAIYEDKIKGTISEERFVKMSQGFENEQIKNKKRIEQLAEEMKNQNREIDTTKMFLDIVEKTTHLEKLTADVVREFIDKIVVHHRQESGGVTTQKVEIYYNVIGKFEIPPTFAEQEQKATA